MRGRLSPALGGAPALLGRGEGCGLGPPEPRCPPLHTPTRPTAGASFPGQEVGAKPTLCPRDAVTGPEASQSMYGAFPRGQGLCPLSAQCRGHSVLGPGPPYFSSPQGLVGVSPGLGLELTPSPKKNMSQRTLCVKCGISMPKAWPSWCEGPQCSAGVLHVAAGGSLVPEPAEDAETHGPALG